MRLSAIPIINFNGINSFCTANQWQIRSGDKNTLYFQLIDLDQTCSCGSCPSRYIAAAGSTMIVTFQSIDCMNVIQATAVQDPNDGSIWSVDISPTQRPNGGAVRFSLTQGANTSNFSVINMLCVEYPSNEGSDGELKDYGTFNYYPSYGED